MPIPGHATPEGTAAFAKRHTARESGAAHAGHFRDAFASSPDGPRMSSIGIGTYLGDPDGRTDAGYRGSVARAAELGINVIDSAVNYRFQRSERSIGGALQDLIHSGRARREELVICTKGGFLSFDGEAPRNAKAWFEETFSKSGVATLADVVAGCHCMTPAYLKHQIARSRENLGVECLDVYYVHNPETQLDEIPRDEFDRRLAAAFGLLEEEVKAGRLRAYGVATWDGFRVEPDAPNHLSLQDVVRAAESAAGRGHHLRFVQLPFNLAMPEAHVLANQRLGDPGSPQPVSILEAVRRLGIAVVASASLLQARVIQRMPAHIAEYIPGLQTPAQRALQFVRSMPGVTTALVGMKDVHHVEENAGLSRIAPLDAGALGRILG